MSLSGRIPPDRLLSEAEVRQVLSRASELDALRSAALSAEELWKVAQEAGISQEAVQQAMVELSQQPAHAGRTGHDLTADAAARTLPAQSTRDRWIRVLRLATSGLVLGVATAFFAYRAPGAGIGVIATLSLMVARSLDLIRRHRSRGTVREFQTELLGLWGAFGVGANFAVGGLPLQSFILPGTLYLMGASVGGMLASDTPDSDPLP